MKIASYILHVFDIMSVYKKASVFIKINLICSLNFKLTYLQEALAAMLLQRVLGSGPHVKRGTGQGKLAKAASAASAGNFAVGGNCFFYAIWEKRHLVFTSSTNSKKN